MGPGEGVGDVVGRRGGGEESSQPLTLLLGRGSSVEARPVPGGRSHPTSSRTPTTAAAAPTTRVAGTRRLVVGTPVGAGRLGSGAVSADQWAPSQYR